MTLWLGAEYIAIRDDPFDIHTKINRFDLKLSLLGEVYLVCDVTTIEIVRI